MHHSAQQDRYASQVQQTVPVSLYDCNALYLRPPFSSPSSSSCTCICPATRLPRSVLSSRSFLLLLPRPPPPLMLSPSILRSSGTKRSVPPSQTCVVKHSLGPIGAHLVSTFCSPLPCVVDPVAVLPGGVCTAAAYFGGLAASPPPRCPHRTSAMPRPEGARGRPP